MTNEERRKYQNEQAARQVEARESWRQSERTRLISEKVELMLKKNGASIEFIRSPEWQKLNNRIAEINAQLTAL